MKPATEWSGIVGRVLIAAVALTVFWLVPGLNFHATSLNFHAIGWVFLSSLLTAAALALVIMTARGSGWGLIGAVGLLYFGVAYFNSFDELLIFRIGVTTRQIAFLVVRGLVITAIFVPFVAWLLGRVGAEETEAWPVVARRSAGGWLWRVVVGDVLYILFYFVAGILVWPFVKSFYANIPMPTPVTVLLMQVFRGLVFVGIAIVVTRSMAGRTGRAALALGLALSVFGGIAPLLMPNTIMPGNVRLAHGFEVGISNLVYGVILAWLFTPRVADAARPLPESAAAGTQA